MTWAHHPNTNMAAAAAAYSVVHKHSVYIHTLFMAAECTAKGIGLSGTERAGMFATASGSRKQIPSSRQAPFP